MAETEDKKSKDWPITGTWEPKYDQRQNIFECSTCGWTQWGRTPYCCQCGARNVKEKDDEKRNSAYM